MHPSSTKLVTKVRESTLRASLESLPAHIRPHIDCGWGNGYVGIPKGHPLYRVDYKHISVRVHGGLTYSREEIWEGVPYWVIGFDTAHYGDTLEDWPKEEVEKETEALRLNIATYHCLHPSLRDYLDTLKSITHEAF